MTAARQQAEEGRFERQGRPSLADERLRGRLEEERGDVPVEVVDRRERQAAPERDSLCCREPDEEGADVPLARPSHTSSHGHASSDSLMGSFHMISASSRLSV